MIYTKKRLRLCTALLAMNLTFIWGNSLLPGEVSAAFSNWVKDVIAMLFSGSGPIREGGGLIRKIAHFAEFCTLGMGFAWLFGMRKKKWGWALLCGSAAACVDETIQRFVPGRGPSIRDVGIDTCGVLTGMILLHFGYFLFKRKNNH